MYLEHFRMAELPFTLTPDTSFFMSRAGYQDALNVLLVALRSGEGFVKVTGEVGTGKTILCRTLLNRLGEGYATAYIPNPYLKPTTLLLAIADELGIDYPADIGQHAFIGGCSRWVMGWGAARTRTSAGTSITCRVALGKTKTARVIPIAQKSWAAACPG